ncbi:hypothetical protein BT63DRAFT_437192 [Microthyrium microscopicum]|uniref:N-acetyltransferase domain-containing protein n=1 Tax=Microthyrium microscopicum TaxID=703497 RepID=A0A6A6UPX6_9PEZI|nr:hypothetical protein BT63DRAFT_437192 [Microthyrium microscopicum]
MYHYKPAEASFGIMAENRIKSSVNCKNFKAVDNETGELVAGADWEVIAHDRAEVLSKRLSEVREQYMGNKAHLYLKSIVVEPNYRGLGIGKMPMACGVKEAGCAGKPLYERVGSNLLGTSNLMRLLMAPILSIPIV